jgi:MFS family permease
MADMQSGIGPFVGVFLQERGWASGLIGTAMTIGNVAGMLITTPIGGFIDASRNKRMWVVIPGICVVAASAIILISQNFWAVTFSQVAQSLASAAIVPAVTGITLGIVKQKGFNQQNGRNQAFNRRQHDWGGAVGLSRVDVRLCRRVRAGGGIRGRCDCLRADDPGQVDRRSRRTRQQGG